MLAERQRTYSAALTMTVSELIAILEQVPDKSLQVAVDDWSEKDKGYIADTAFAICEEEGADGITRLQIAPSNSLNYYWTPDVIHYKPSPARRMVKNGEVIDLYY